MEVAATKTVAKQRTPGDFASLATDTFKPCHARHSSEAARTNKQAHIQLRVASQIAEQLLVTNNLEHSVQSRVEIAGSGRQEASHQNDIGFEHVRRVHDQIVAVT